VAGVTGLYNLSPGHVPLPAGSGAGGSTSAANPFVNFTGGNQTAEEIIDIQIFELGNSLGFITGKQLPSRKTPWNVTGGKSDNEPGQKLLDCYTAK
jgi:fucose permease